MRIENNQWWYAYLGLTQDEEKPQANCTKYLIKNK